MLTYALACNTGTFAAIGPDSATQLDKCVAPRNVDGCAPPATTTDGATTTSTAGCPDGRNVVLVAVDGGGHEWPPFATQSLWQFFAAH
jgi:polyhydroxybutyrate depolymerase